MYLSEFLRPEYEYLEKTYGPGCRILGQLVGVHSVESMLQQYLKQVAENESAFVEKIYGTTYVIAYPKPSEIA